MNNSPLKKHLKDDFDLFFNCIEFSNEIIILCDPDGKIVYLNQNARKYFEFFTSETLNLHISRVFEFFPEENLSSIFQNGWSGHLSTKISYTDKSYVHLICKPIYTSNHKEKIIAFSFVVTEEDASLVPLLDESDHNNSFEKFNLQKNQDHFSVPLGLLENQLHFLSENLPPKYRPNLKRLQLAKEQLQHSVYKLLTSEQNSTSYDLAGSDKIHIPLLIKKFLADHAGKPAIRLKNSLPEIDFSMDPVKMLYTLKHILLFIRGKTKDSDSIDLRINYREDRNQIHILFSFLSDEQILFGSEEEQEASLENSLPYCKKIIALYKGSWKLSSSKVKRYEFDLIFPLNLDPYSNLSIQILLIDTDETLKKQIEQSRVLKDHPTDLSFFQDLESATKAFEDTNYDIVIFDPKISKKTVPEKSIHQSIGLFSGKEKGRFDHLISVSDFWKKEEYKKVLLNYKNISCYPKPIGTIDLEILISNEINFVKRHRNLSGNVKNIQKDALTDELTTLNNRRHFESVIPILVQKASNNNQPISFIMVDIDHFKIYNDQNGHQAGDELLKWFARVLKSGVRVNDLVVRWGGEEFIVILPNASRENGRLIAEKLRNEVENTFFPHSKKQPLGKVTASFGISVFSEDSENIKELIKIADENLYISKENGRNCVTCRDFKS